MKIEKEKMKKIFLEEMRNVLKEEHAILDQDSDSNSKSMLPPDNDDKPKPVTADEFGKSLAQTAKDIKSSDSKQNAKPNELGLLQSELERLLAVAFQEGDASSVLKKVTTAIESALKSNKGK